MLASGALASSTWTADPMLFLFQMAYILLLFMILLNFIIAILVEAYMVVKQEIEDKQSEQAFWTDCMETLEQWLLRRVHRWPRHNELITSLIKTPKGVIDYQLLRHLFPLWRDHSSMVSWMTYYGRYEFLRTSPDAIASHEHSQDGEDSKFLSPKFRRFLTDELCVSLVLASA